jgi:hypothetical protein
MEIDRDYLVDLTRKYIGEMVAGLCLILLVLMLIVLKKQYTIGVIGLVSITAIALEARAKPFDKIVSVLVIFSLAVGFMVFD